MAKTERPKRRIRWSSVFLTLLAILLLLVAYGWHLHRSVPAQWDQMNETLSTMSEEELANAAQSIETLIVNESQGIDSDQGPSVQPNLGNEVTERRVVIPVKDANIWLSTRLHQLLANQNASMPYWLRQPRVWIDDGQLVLSGRLNTSKLRGVVSVYLDGKMLEDGTLRLQATKARSGRLPIPTGMLENLLREKVRETGDADLRQVADLFKGVVVDPVMRSWNDDRRKLRLLELELFEDRVEMLIRTSPTLEKVESAE